MLDRRSQIEGILEYFQAMKHRLLSGTHILSPRNQIPNSQWMVLRIVYQNDGIGVKEISHKLGISSSAATQLVDSLVKKGCLVREESVEDRRALKIRLSGKTKELIDVTSTQAIGKVQTIFDVLTDEEIQTFYKLSVKVANNILDK
jgi:DNA-binding MarR family transcriptional regulator